MPKSARPISTAREADIATVAAAAARPAPVPKRFDDLAALTGGDQTVWGKPLIQVWALHRIPARRRLRGPLPLAAYHRR
jgi:hypothetical protein